MKVETIRLKKKLPQVPHRIKEFPSEFKLILKKAGFKKKHLKKKETAIVIYEYLLKHTEIEEEIL